MADTSSIWQSNNAAFSELKGEALAAMGRLESAARAQVYNVVEYHSPGAVHTPGEYPSIDVNSLPTVDEVMGKVNAISPDMFPTPPSADEIIKFRRNVWESDQLDKIESTIMSYIASAGMPSQDFQNAIFDQNRERRQRALNDDIDLIKAQTSARGFRYANGMTTALIADLVEKNQYDRENLNREITKLMAEWARDNLMWSVQQGASIESSRMDFSYKFSSIYREI